MVRSGSETGLSIVTMAIQYLPRYGSQRSMDKLSGRCEVRYAKCRFCCLQTTQCWSLEDLEHNISALQTAVKEHRLVVKWTKTNTIAIGRETTGCKVEVVRTQCGECEGGSISGGEV